MKFINTLKQALMGCIVAAAVVGTAPTSNAAQITVTIPGNTITNILVGAGRISQFVLTSSSTTNNTLAFYDCPSNTLTYIINAYSNVVLTVGSYTNIYTNYFNVLTTNIYTAQTTSTNSVGPLTNTYNGLLTAQVTANSTLTIGTAVATYPNASLYYFFNGVTVTNIGTGPAAATLTYQQ